MPRSNNITVQNNFTKGLITEATGLTFPENACTSTDNCIFNHFGKVTRRPGFDIESFGQSFAATKEGNVIVSYLWSNVAGDGDRVFVVVQIGATLHFYAVSSDNPLSANKHSDTIDLNTWASDPLIPVNNLECQFSSGNGYLFVTNRRTEAVIVRYSVDDDTITGDNYEIRIRDFKGDPADDLDIDDHDDSLTAFHEYNLHNQGWTDSTIDGYTTETEDDYPANNEISWAFKNADNELDWTLIDDIQFGNSPAPRGHYKYSVYDINRSDEVSGATDESIPLERVSTSCFFAGRVFYSGLNVEGQNSRIFFTQILGDDLEELGNCFQVNDPTAEQYFDLLPSDGGVIDILEAGTVFKMINVLNSLIVFASNGTWAITGSQGVGFTANDYSVQKISSVRNISHTSFVDVEGMPYWWNLEGIYTLTMDSQTNALRVKSITDESIRSFYLDIPAESKQFARGTYDQFNKRVQWIYKSDAADSFEDKYSYDRMLTLNLLSGAFFPWSVDISEVKINSIVNVFGLSGVFENSQVIANVSDTVIANTSDNVIVFQSANQSAVSSIKYFVNYQDSGTKFTFAECFRPTNRDWADILNDTGVSYDSEFITGYAIRGQAMRKFQQNYVSVYSENLVDSSFQISGMYNYATDGSTGHWSTVQVISNFTAFRPKRIKIRGHGLTCQLKFRNNGDDPFTLVGWSVFETANNWI